MFKQFPADRAAARAVILALLQKAKARVTHADSDHSTREEAAARVAYLNGQH